MNKKVRKLRPNDYWRIGEHESWFTDMAARGLHLQKMGLFFAHFVKGEPKKMKFRIDVSMNKKITPEGIQMYEKSGWAYRTSYYYFHVYASPAQLHAPELHSDPAEQSYTLEDLDNKLTLNACIASGAMIFMMAMLSAIWLLDGTPTYTLIEGIAITQTISIMFFGYTSYHSLQAAFSIRALRKKLTEGKPIDHHAPWKKYYRSNVMATFLFPVLVGLGAIIPFVQLAKGETKTLPEGNVDLPIIRLGDVEKNPALIRGETSYMIDDVDWANRYTFNWSPFAPIQYEADESGIVPGEMWGDESGEYSPSISNSVYKLSMAALADDLIYDLIKRHAYKEKDFVRTPHSELDLLIVYEEEGRKEIFASKGKGVIYVRYFGVGDKESIIENIVEKIHLIAD